MPLHPSFWRRFVILSGVLATAAALLVVLAHAPFVRATVLRYLISTVQEQYDLRLEAGRLDYNLVALRVGLADLRVSALHTPDEPFVTADYLSVTLPWRTLLGDIAVDDISVTNARVLVRRREDGSSNLPPASGTRAADPQPLRIRRLDVPQMSIDLRDEQGAMFLWLPSLALRLAPNEGFVRLGRDGQLNSETQVTRISRLNGGASFDGRAIHFEDLELRSDEGTARVDGSLTLVARDQVADLSVRGSIDATRVARWVVSNGELPGGEVAFEAQAAGAFDDLETRLRVTSERLSWQSLTVTDLVARTRITTVAADIEELQFGFEGGRATAVGSVPFSSDATGRVKAALTGIDLAAATKTLAPDATVLPAGFLLAEISAEGPGSDVARWSGTARTVVSPGRNATGRVAVAGDAFLKVRDGIWHLEGRTGVVGSSLPAMFAFRGDLNNAVDGTIHVGQTDIALFAEALREAGVTDIQPDVIRGGTLEGDIQVAGTIEDPTIEGRAVVDGAAVAQADEGLRVDVTLLQADFSGRPLQPDVAFRAEVSEAIAADQRLRDMRTVGRFVDGMLVVDTLSASQPSGPGRLTASGTYDIDSGRYKATLEGSQWMLASADDQPLAASLDVRFIGEGTVEAPHGMGNVTVADAMWRDIALGPLDASIELDGRMARIEARAPEFAASGSGHIALESPYESTVDISAQAMDVSRLTRFVDLPSTLTGTATLRLHADLPLETWRSGSATLDVTSLSAKTGELSVELPEPARIRYEAERAHIDRLEIAAGDMAVSALGSLPVFEPAPDAPAVVLTVTGNIDGVVRTATALGLTELPVTGGDGPVALLSRVTGTIQQPVVAADLEVGPASVGLTGAPPVTGVVVRAHAERGAVELRQGEAAWQGAQLTATGGAPLSMLSDRLALVGGAASSGPGADVAALRARATNLTPAVLAPFVDSGALAELSGSMDVILDVASPALELADLTGELRIDRFDLRVANLPVSQKVPTSIVARDGFARVEAWEWVGQGTTLSVRGQVRLDDRQVAILANGTVDLRLLTPFLRDAALTTAGRLEPRLSITGTLENPRIDGDAVIADGELRLQEPRLVVSDLAARAVLSRTTASISQLTGSVNGGPLTGGGTIEYTAGGGFETQLSTEIRGMALDYPAGLRSEVDADLSFAFSHPPGDSDVPGSGKLSGTVTFLQGTYREPMAVLTGLLATLRTQQLAPGSEPSPFLRALALDVRLVTDEDLLVNNNYARVQLGADLRLIGTAAAPALSGRADLREGGQLFVGRNVYTVNFGAIDFSNPVAIEPNLNVEATTRAGGEDIQVTITGPAESPTVDLRSTSNPDLGQAEVASLLLTGRRLENLAPEDAAAIGTQVLGNFSGEVLGFASRAVGLDTLRLGGVENQVVSRDFTEVATTQLDPTNRLTFGKSIGSNLDVTFSQSLRDGDAQTWIVDYVPLDNLELRVVSDDSQLRSYAVRHQVELGAGTRLGGKPAGSPQQVPRVTTVNIAGDLAIPEGRVRDTLRLGSGDRFDFAEWQDDRDRLENLYRNEGYFAAQITARRAAEAAGVALNYLIEAGPQTRIVVTGIELDSALRSRLETAWVQSVFDGFLVEEAAQIVRDELGRRGYLQPRVEVAIRDDAAMKTLDIVVDPGPRTTRTEVRIDGTTDALRDEIIAHLRERGLIEPAVLNAGAVEREVAAFLTSRGHVRARVAAGAPLFAEGTAVLPVRVDPESVFTIGSISFDGTPTLPDVTLREAAGLEEGTPYDTAATEAARNRLVALLRREGFASASVTVRPSVNPDDPRVAVSFLIQEGRRQVLEEITVTGNRAIDADVILRALDLPLDEPLRADNLLQARTRVFDTNLFRRVDLTAELVESTDEIVAPMRLRVAVEEWPQLRLRYGFVVAEEHPEDDLEARELVPGVSADVIRRTLFGRAFTIGAAMGLQRREQAGRIFGNAPTFMGLPIQSSLVGERSRQEFQTSSFVTSRTSVTWQQLARVARNLSLSYSYTFERNHTFDTRSLEEGGLAFDVTVNIARLNGAAAWDTRDDPLDATRGLFASTTFEFAPEAAGSDIRFVRQLQQVYYFRPWRAAVFASAARVGVAIPVGGQDLIPSERFFAGGSRTVRGVAEEGLGPRNFFGDPTGGQTMIVLNQEVRLPLYRWVRAVGFLDAGNVFARPRDASLRDLVGSVGFGLRVATPFALLRVDFGQTVWGLPESSNRWSFGLGQIF